MKKLISLLLTLAIVLSMAACGASPAPTEAATEAATEEVFSGAETTVREDFVFVDDCGREVEVPGEISRIVPTGPLSQIILYTIAPDMFVGIASKWAETAKGLVPEEYLNLTYFGQLYNTANLNVEELALADPQLIIDVGQAMSTGTEDMDNLQEQVNIPTLYISASLETAPEAYRKLGKLLNREEKAEQLAQFCERIYAQTLDVMEKVGDNKANCLYVLGEKGLSVLAKDSFHSELIDMLTNNVAVVDNPSSKGSGNEVTMEQIALWNPDYVLFAPDSIYDTVQEMDTWTEISAIQNGNYIKIPEGPHNWIGTPPSVQRYLGLIWLTAQLYPEYCDYDAEAQVYEYYKLFYDCELTAEQFETLTANAYLN